jgi:hypothetical protein
MLKCWSIEDRSSVFCLPYNCASVRYSKLLLHEPYVISYREISRTEACIADQNFEADYQFTCFVLQMIMTLTLNSSDLHIEDQMSYEMLRRVDS